MPKTAFPYQNLVKIARSLPEAHEMTLTVPDFATSDQILNENSLSNYARLHLKAYKPLLDKMDLSGVPKHLETTYQMAAAHAIHRTILGTNHREATLAGVALPTFTRLKILTVLRLYPKLRALQLFGFLPMSQPTARLHFKKYKYGDPLTSSTPNIAAGDSVDDITKANPDYVAVAEGEMARKVTFEYKFLDISAKDQRIVAEWSEQLEDDASSVYGDDAESSHLDTCAYLMGLGLDRDLINSAIAAVPAQNKDTWDATPAEYDAMTPSEQDRYDTRLYKYGVVSVLEKIRKNCKYAPEGQPNWAIADTNASLLLRRTQGFKSREIDLDQISIEAGPVEIGQFTDYGVRVFIDPLYNQNNGSQGKILFGRRPVKAGEASIYLGMYVPMVVTPGSYQPLTGFTMKGVRSRYAIAKPNTGTEAESAELARSYGELTITL